MLGGGEKNTSKEEEGGEGSREEEDRNERQIGKKRKTFGAKVTRGDPPAACWRALRHFGIEGPRGGRLPERGGENARQEEAGHAGLPGEELQDQLGQDLQGVGHD